MFQKLLALLQSDSTRAKAARGFIAGAAISAIVNNPTPEPYQGDSK